MSNTNTDDFICPHGHKPPPFVDGLCAHCWKHRAETAEAKLANEIQTRLYAKNETLIVAAKLVKAEAELRAAHMQIDLDKSRDAVRADKAEAAVADMRAFITKYNDTNPTHKLHCDDPDCWACHMIRIMSIDCGTGWLSPDRANDLLHDHNAMASNLAAFCKQLDAGDPGQAMAMLISMKEREKLLVEALEHWQRYQRMDVPTTAEQQEKSGKEFAACWTETQQALATVKPTL